MWNSIYTKDRIWNFDGHDKNYTVVKHTSSTNNSAWKDVQNDEKLLIELLRSTIPQGYINITYIFFMNILPKGVLTNQSSKGEIVGSSYSCCTKVGSEMLIILNFKILIDCLSICCDWTLNLFS